MRNLRRVLGALHDLAPESVHRLVSLALDWQLTVDVLRAEDRLQVEPLALTRDPLVQHVLTRMRTTTHQQTASTAV